MFGFTIRNGKVTTLAVCIRADPKAEEDRRLVAMRAFDESMVVIEYSIVRQSFHLKMNICTRR